MKKLFYILMVLAVAMFSSCRGDEGPMGPQGPAGPAGIANGSGLQFLNFEFTVDQDKWELVEEKTGEKYFTYHFDFEELDLVMVNEAIINVYLYVNGEHGDRQAPLPRVVHMKHDEKEYTQTIDFEFDKGSLDFFCTQSDFYTEKKPETMYFKVLVYYPVD